jgi:UDP-2,3-diacylglucosamine pyrophosphatase LpxH
MSPDTPRRVYLAQPGDGHCGTTNQADAFAEWVAWIECEVLVLAGDLLDTQDLSVLLKKMTRADLRMLRVIHKKHKQGVRIILMPGNHDPDYPKMFGEVRNRLSKKCTKKEERILETLRCMEEWEYRRGIFVDEYLVDKSVHIHGHEKDPFVNPDRWWTRALVHAFSALWSYIKLRDNWHYRVVPMYKLIPWIKQHFKKWIRTAARANHYAAEVATFAHARYAFNGHTHRPRRMLSSEHQPVEVVDCGSTDTTEFTWGVRHLDGTAGLYTLMASRKPVVARKGMRK